MDENESEEKEVFVLADDKSKLLKVFCGICNDVFRQPYVSACGHTFCQNCCTDVGRAKVCPLDNTKLSAVVRNIALQEQVGELLIHCRYGCRVESSSSQHEVDPSGCHAVIKISERHQHELQCGFRPVSCPNSELCQQMLKRDLEEHLQNCQHIPCPHHKFGCEFSGSKTELNDHLVHCSFEGVKGFLLRLDRTMNELQQDIKNKDEKCSQLGELVSELRDKLERTEIQSTISSKRVDHLEQEQAEMREQLVQAHSSIKFFTHELKQVELQLGLAGTTEAQHLFRCQGTFVGHKGPVWSLCTVGDLLFSASSDSTIKVWNLSATYGGPRTLTGHDGIVLALCSQSQLLYSGSSDKTIKIWDTRSLQLQRGWMAHDDPVCTLAATDSTLFSGSLRSIKVWNLQDQQLMKTLPTQNHWVRALVASGNFLYSGSYQAVKIWSLESLEVAHVLQCSGGSVYSLAVSNTHIICGTYENMIHLWDVNSLDEVGSFSGHTGTIYDLAVLQTPGQPRLFSASYDKTIRVWNTELRTCAQALTRHEGSVTCLTIAKGKLISGSVDNSVKVWQ